MLIQFIQLQGNVTQCQQEASSQIVLGIISKIIENKPGHFLPVWCTLLVFPAQRAHFWFSHLRKVHKNLKGYSEGQERGQKIKNSSEQGQSL